jgi:predicted RND superfamily exporter protein
MMTVIITMGLLIGLGFTVHIMSSMIPIFLMPIAVVDSVHIMSEFVNRYDPESGRASAVRDVIGHLYKPMLFTSLTTAVGFLSLMLTPIPPVQIFGAFVALGVLLAFFLTIVFVPAYIVRMNPKSLVAMERLHSGGAGRSPLGRGLRTMGRFAFGRGKLVMGVTTAVIALSVAGIMRIEINDNPVRWFKESQEIRIADRVLNEHFAGTYDAFLVLSHEDPAALGRFELQALPLIEDADIQGADLTELRDLMSAPPASLGFYFDEFVASVDDALFESDFAAEESLLELMSLTEAAQSQAKYFQSPAAILVIEELQEALADTGLVGKTNSLADVVKVVTRELRSGEPDDYRVPDSVAGVAQTLLQFQSSHRPQDLWHMVTPDFTSTAIWLQLTSGDNQDMTQVLDSVGTYLTEHPLPAGVQARWAGKAYINVVWQQEMVAGMLKSLLGAFVIVFLMMSVLFRSALFGLLAMVPLTVTILAVYGLIGWIGKDYDMPIAVLSSLTLGLSVDFAIHFLQRMRSLYETMGSFAKAAEAVLEEPARAIGRNAIVIAFGFTPLFFAPLIPYITVGAFMAAIMVISALATLVVLPALLGSSRRWLFNPPRGGVPEVSELAETKGVGT